MNNRRKLVIVLGAGALTASFGSLAQQQGKVWRVGFLGSASAASYTSRTEALREGLRTLHLAENKNYVIEARYADGAYERLPGLAEELVKLKVDVIVAEGTPGIAASRQATSTIPIVMVAAGDPVGKGFVASLSRPGGNITGLSNVAVDVSIKYLELLHEAVPKLTRVAVLINPDNATHVDMMKNVQAAAKATSVSVTPIEVRSEGNIEAAFIRMARERAGAIIALADAFFTMQRRQLAELALKNRLPSMFSNPALADAGGLMSYGQDLTDHVRRAATYVEKVLKGAKPADLPVEQPTKLELIINLKTAKALGIKLPNSILVRADRVIE